MKIQVYLCPASSFVTRVPHLKKSIHELMGKASITVQIDDSIRHDYCMVDGRSDSVMAKKLMSYLDRHVESDGVKLALMGCS